MRTGSLSEQRDVRVDCEKPRVVTCANEPCLNSANCTDLYDALTLLANNYTCHGPFGFDGINCENPINYCSVLDPCRNGAFCTGVSFEPLSFYSIPNE